MDLATTRLAEDRERTQARLAALRGELEGVKAASRDSNADDEHDPEGATIAYERARTQALAEQAERRLSEIDAALRRVVEGGYGTCESCGKPIPEDRLEARPTATTCVQHSAR